MVQDAQKVAKPTKGPRVLKRGIGTVVKESVLAGMTNEDVLEAVKAEFPNANTTASTISWYRNSLRKSGNMVPTARAIKKAAAGHADAGHADAEHADAEHADAEHADAEHADAEHADADPLA